MDEAERRRAFHELLAKMEAVPDVVREAFAALRDVISGVERGMDAGSVNAEADRVHAELRELSVQLSDISDRLGR